MPKEVKHRKRTGEPRSAKAKESKEKKEPKEFTIEVRKKDPWPKALHWTARGLGLFILLVATSFMVMSNGFSFASLREMILIVALAAVLLCAWHYEVAGGAIYLFLGLTYLFISLFSADFMTLIIVTTPMLVTGGLFMAEGLIKLHK
ncbi:TPA: hypothetical protein HA265_04810 [Candidatus Woesearchaeota archaeon]|nr:hypothetical protein [Candidatus Woesearchaeota archaeon]